MSTKPRRNSCLFSLVRVVVSKSSENFETQSTPLNVRLHEYQENKLNEMIKNESYCRKKGLYSKADALRSGLNNVIKDYEMTTLGT